MKSNGASPLEFDDIQGLVQRGYKELPLAEYLLLEVTDPLQARRSLAHLANVVEPATAQGCDKKDRVSAIHLALTWHGLRRLGLNRDILDQFPLEFREGMVTEHRKRLLGDSDNSDPAHWHWGNKKEMADGEEQWHTDPHLHIIVMLYAQNDSTFSQNRNMVLQLNGLRRLETTPLDTIFLAGPEPDLEGKRNGPKEHFGFRDGIAQPHIAGMPPAEGSTVSPDNTIAAGEVLLGYLNAYDEMPEGPTDSTGQGFGRNGTFLVFRQLHQNVAQFWTYVAQQAAANGSTPVELAAKMVGRWPDGTPLVESPEGPQTPLQTHDQFVYAGHPKYPDPHGFHCPIGSHIRRTNPRDSLGDIPQRSMKLSNLHRMVRRGRSYGTPLIEDMDPAKLVKVQDDGAERGLHFICLNAAIDRQFEFVQNQWANNPKFGELYDDPDPLIGVATESSGSFTVQSQPVRQRYSALPRFVEMRGGAYFFLPGIAAIRMLAELKE
jgi:Dyp-type peroxidase family